MLIDIGGYFINGYWWLFYQWILVAILSMDIGGYSINGYQWLFYEWILIINIGYYINDY